LFGGEAAKVRGYMDGMRSINRRFFLCSGAVLCAPLVSSSQPKNENVYRFATAEWDIQMTVEFYDRYASNGFWFNERKEKHRFCLSAKGEEGHDCLENFLGSLAIVRYHVQPRLRLAQMTSLREHVRTIDRDSRVTGRPPLDRRIELQQGVASDIQAFGYQADASSLDDKHPPELNEPWCLFRQDLYLSDHNSPFLVIHWKHTLNAIRILDFIPGNKTRLVEK
jgi:hypothetical protein